MKMKYLTLFFLLGTILTTLYVIESVDSDEQPLVTQNNRTHLDNPATQDQANKPIRSSEREAERNELSLLEDSFRPRVLERIKFENEPFEVLFEAYRKGSAVAAFKLYRQNEECSRFAIGAQISIEISESTCRMQQELAPLQIYEFLTFAANFGLLEAQLEAVLYDPSLTFNEEDKDYEKVMSSHVAWTVKMLNSAIDKGSAEAFFWMADAKYAGYFVEKNDLDALMYAIVAQKVFTGLDNNRSIAAFASSIAAGVSPSSVEIARGRAAKYLQSKDCCSVFKN